MDFLWTFGDMDDRRRDCVRHSLRQVGADDRVLVSVDRPDRVDGLRLPDDAEVRLDSDLLPMALDEVRNPDFWRKYISRPHFPQAKSDFLRLWMACKKPHLYYMDTDVRLFRFPEFVPGKPYLGQFGRGVDFFMFYTNERCDWFRGLMERVEKTRPEAVFIPFLLGDPKIRLEVGMIERRWFRHERNTTNCPIPKYGNPHKP